MKLKLYIFLLISYLTVSLGFCQEADDYAFTTNKASSLISLTAPIRLLAAGAVNISSAVTPIGFEFWFMGVRHTSFSVNANGAIQLGEQPIVTGGNAYTIAGAARIIAFSAGEVNPTTNAVIGNWRVSATDGVIQYQVFGNAPNRFLVVECKNMNINFQSTTNDATFQIVLYETAPLASAANRGGRIEFRYGQIRTAYEASSIRVGIGIGTANNQSKGVDLSVNPPTARIGNSAIENKFSIGTIDVLDGSADGSRRIIAFESPYPNAQATALRTACTGIDGEIKLDWDNTATNAVGSVLYRSTDGINFSFLAQTNIGTNTLTDRGLQTGRTYYYRVFSVTEGKLCELNASGQISVTISPPTVLNLGADKTICKGLSVSLDGGAGFLSYEWSSGEKTQKIEPSPSQTTSYILTVTDNQCRKQSDTVRVIVQTPFKITVDDVPSICEGEMATFDAGAGFASYAWQEVGTNRTGNSQTFMVSTTNNVVVTVKNQEGCSASDTAKVRQIIPRKTLKISGRPVICNGAANMEAESGYKLYEWADSKGNVLQSSANASISLREAGKYTVSAKDSLNCGATGEVTITECCEPVLDIPNAFTPHSTPANNIFRVRHENLDKFKMQIYDRWGVLVFLSEDPESGWNGNALGRPCESGVYQVIVEYSGCENGKTVRGKKQEVLNLLE